MASGDLPLHTNKHANDCNCSTMIPGAVKVIRKEEN